MLVLFPTLLISLIARWLFEKDFVSMELGTGGFLEIPVLSYFVELRIEHRR